MILLDVSLLVDVACAMGHPVFVKSSSFMNQEMAQIEMCIDPDKFLVWVHILPKKLDKPVVKA